MTSWSNPNPSPTYAELMRGHTFSGGGAGHYNAAPNQWAQAGQQAISAVAQIMQEKKRQDIAQTLLDHASYDSNDGQGDPLAAKLNESSMAPADAWKAYQQQREMDAQQLNQSIKQQQLQKLQTTLAKGGEAQQPTPMYDDQGDLIGYSSPKGAPHFLPQGMNQSADKKLTSGLSSYGLEPDDLGNLDFNSLNFVDANGQPMKGAAAGLDPSKVFVTGTAGDKSFKIPKSQWDKYAQTYKNLNPSSPDASPAPATGGKPLDQATAAAILKEAGGDPDKARELARERGYSF